MSAPVLSADRVTKSFWLGKREIPILRGVDLQVAPGEMVALLGASGAGKSTLLHVLGLLDAPTGGAVNYDGRPVHDLSVVERARLRHQHVGFVFQFYHLIPELTALQNVTLARMMQCSVLQYWRERGAVRAAATTLLDEVGLGQRLQHRPAELSGGERQRVAIARALLAQPRVILADEPTGNLDSTTSDEVVQTLRALSAQHGVTVIVVTHAEEVARHAARRIRLRDGQVLTDGS